MLLAASQQLQLIDWIASSPAGVIAVAALLLAELTTLRALGDRVTGQILGAVERGGGRKLVLYPLLAPGVALHELGHAVAALAIGSRVRKIVLFKPTRSAEGAWTLGYVEHDQPGTLVGRAFVSFAPLLLPPFFLYALAPLLVPVSTASRTRSRSSPPPSPISTRRPRSPGLPSSRR
jgi:hypothetical protein